MGSVQLPRVYFTGQQFWNPNTVNNNDYGGAAPSGINTWDPPHAEFNSDYLKSKGVTTDEQIPAFLRTPLPYNAPGREVAPAEWGLYGGQQCGFVTEEFRKTVNAPFTVPPGDTLVTGYTDRQGNFGTDPGTEPWVRQPLQLDTSNRPAKLVDVNPMSFWSSQIFTRLFTLGTPTNGFTGQPVARMHSRLISKATRNYNSKNDLVIAAEYGCVFQTCLDKSTIHFNGDGGPVQDGFQWWLANGAQGLMLRYSAYRTLYFQGTVFPEADAGNRYPSLKTLAKLWQDFANNGGDAPISRAYSKVNGWIGIWMPGELASMPGGRFLIPYTQFPAEGKQPIGVTPSNLSSEQYSADFCQQRSNAPDNTDGKQCPPSPLGPATVEVDSDGDGNPTRITLDLANTIPECDSTCVKADFGTVRLGLFLSGGLTKWVPQDVPYDKAAYEKQGGLVDLPMGDITKEDLARGQFLLQVESGQSGATERVQALYENVATAHTDPRGLYADQPDPAFSDGNAPDPGPGMPSTGPVCTLQVRYAGLPPSESKIITGMKLHWSALDYSLNAYGPGSPLPIEVRWRPHPRQGQPPQAFQSFDAPIDVPGDGLVDVQVISKGAAIPNLFFLPWSNEQGEYRGAPVGTSTTGPPPVLWGFGSADYVVIKCLSWDNECAVAFDRWLERKPALDTVNQVVWNLVFNTYFFAFPVMDFIANPTDFMNSAPGIYQLTAPKGFDQPAYMPVMRTWSGGQRHIMVSYWNYLQQVNAGKVETEPGVPVFECPERTGLVAARSAGPAGVTLGHG